MLDRLHPQRKSYSTVVVLVFRYLLLVG